ncbi:MAG: hypothetical protein KAF40_01430 [Flavihumibacter sp.]|nr:hypothetical protein [Flavihumibacter sp.]
MKIPLLILFLLASLFSYSQSQVINKSPQETWQAVVEAFAKKGIAIQAIDRETGLIVSTQQSFTDKYCYSKKLNSGCQVELWDGVKENPSVVSGFYNVIIKPAGDKTEVLISLVNLESYYEKEMRGYKKKYPFKVKSTGKFETEFIDLIK